MNRAAVILDMDGVILDSEPIYRDCWKRAARDLGFEISDELYTRVIGRRDGEAEEILTSALGKDFPLEEFRRRWPEHWNGYVQAHEIPLKPGVTEFLEFLERERIPKAIATSTARDKALVSLGALRRRFDAMVTGDEVERGKPAPDVFLTAAQRLRVPSSRCWVVEDSEPGIQAAHAAGMRAIIIPDLEEPTAEVRSLAECVCRSLVEVRELLASRL